MALSKGYNKNNTKSMMKPTSSSTSMESMTPMAHSNMPKTPPKTMKAPVKKKGC